MGFEKAPAPDGATKLAFPEVALEEYAQSYRGRVTGYGWITSDRRTLCTADSGGVTCYVAPSDRPPFGQVPADRVCGNAHGQPVADSTMILLRVRDGYREYPCLGLLQGQMAVADSDGLYPQEQFSGSRYAILPARSSIVVPTSAGAIRCVEDAPALSCHFVDTGAGFRISPTVAELNG